MEVKQIIVELDREISRLKEARALLAGERSKGRRASTSATKASTNRGRRGKRNLTPEGRKRISEALKRRWAERRKARAQKAA